jgi:hypothetical protein
MWVAYLKDSAEAKPPRFIVCLQERKKKSDIPKYPSFKK